MCDNIYVKEEVISSVFYVKSFFKTQQLMLVYVRERVHVCEDVLMCMHMLDRDQWQVSVSLHFKLFGTESLTKSGAYWFF